MAFSAPAQAVTVFDFQTSDGGFTATANGTSGFTWTSGTGWSTPGQGPIATNTLTSPVLYVQSTGDVVVTLSHLYNFEPNYDGGQLLYSVNGEAFTLKTNFIGGYNGLISCCDGSTIADQPAWTSNSGGSTVSVANLGSFTVGDQVQIQFLGAWDLSSAQSAPNWQINSLTVTNAGATPVPFESDALPVMGATLFFAGGMWWKKKRNQTKLAEFTDKH